MSLLWLGLGALALWALVRLGRQTESARRGHWRVAATLLATAALGGGLLAAMRGAWIIGAALAAAGLWLVLASRQRTVSPRREDLSAAEARSILGVAPDADAAAINAAWRRLMARAHPDQGGTEGLAARLNAARDRLLRP
ncbi:MAG: molecular chaperone DnaJ [Brevundimonas sp.]|uniref:molecular chaperone DnaJ n=1 Tax=Brevundimonas sp. TaxID=1871086 RepID=UPI0025B8190C|nr:molecular chaperone DnaJ [Brevundimonas sp.]MBX3476105.1 molecular chaperone DnaJ [Brevundimonas sp.]